jgi:hypothetical protein
MDQSGDQRSRSMTSESASTSGFSQEVSASVIHILSPSSLTNHLQFLNMLEPSFALVKRHEQDQSRIAAERELRLQQQLEQMWLRIGRLEHYAQKSEADKATLERLLRGVVQENLALMDRVQKLEANEAGFRRRLTQIESVRDHQPAADSSTTSPETEIISVRSTPDASERGQEVERASALDTAELDSVKLHPMLPSVLFIADPENNKTSDGLDFPLKLISALRSILKDTLSAETIDATKLAKVRNMTGSIKGRCLYRYLKIPDDRKRCVWTKEHEQQYACRTCVNMQRLCMRITGGQILVLPLHPLLKTFVTLPTELEYWVAARGMSTMKAPYNVDIWSVPAGQH